MSCWNAVYFVSDCFRSLLLSSCESGQVIVASTSTILLHFPFKIKLLLFFQSQFVFMAVFVAKIHLSSPLIYRVIYEGVISGNSIHISFLHSCDITQAHWCERCLENQVCSSIWKNVALSNYSFSAHLLCLIVDVCSGQQANVIWCYSSLGLLCIFCV